MVCPFSALFWCFLCCCCVRLWPYTLGLGGDVIVTLREFACCFLHGSWWLAPACSGVLWVADAFLVASFIPPFSYILSFLFFLILSSLTRAASRPCCHELWYSFLSFFCLLSFLSSFSFFLSSFFFLSFSSFLHVIFLFKFLFHKGGLINTYHIISLSSFQ